MRALVAAVSTFRSIVLTMDGQLLPIADWVDGDGVVGAGPADAAFCVAGPDARGKWWTVDVRRLEAVTIQ